MLGGQQATELPEAYELLAPDRVGTPRGLADCAHLTGSDDELMEPERWLGDPIGGPPGSQGVLLAPISRASSNTVSGWARAPSFLPSAAASWLRRVWPEASAVSTEK